MIRRNTVYILGAGASFPYGFPLGAKLRQDILNVDAKFLHDVRYFGGAKPTRIDQDILMFNQAFAHSKALSIDSFLANRTEYADVGRIAIAEVLLNYEKLQPLFDGGNADDWYGALFNSMRTEFSKFIENRVSFVTFNYDRSLELAFQHFVMHTYAKNESEAWEILKNFPIVHVYGSLGSLDPNAPDFVPYGGGRYAERNTQLMFNVTDVARREHELKRFVSIAAKQIKVIPEHRDDVEPNYFHQARELLTKAERVAILGFAFDDLNVRRLSPELPSAIRRLEREYDGDAPCCAATVFGMAQAEVMKVAKSLANDRFDLRQYRLHNMTSLQMLRHTGIHICDDE